MYKLKTSDVSNGKIYESILENLDVKKQLINSKLSNIDMATYYIYNEEIAESDYRTFSAILTLGDELPIPITEKTAKLLYFVLNVNYAHFSEKFAHRIRNIQHAILLYTSCNGEFRDLDIKLKENEDGKQNQLRFTKFIARHRLLFPEMNVYWKIPVSHYSEDGKQKVCLSSGSWATYAECQFFEDGEVYKIPRDIFVKFFEGSFVKGVLSGDSSEYIKLAFDETDSKTLLEVLSYCGFRKAYEVECDDNIDYFIGSEPDKALLARLLKKGTSLFKNQDEEILWNKVDLNTYRFLRRGVQYLPTRPNNRRILIFMQ